MTENPSPEKTGTKELPPATGPEKLAVEFIVKAKKELESTAREMLIALKDADPNDRAIALETMANACYTHLVADLVANSAFNLAKSPGHALKIAADIVKHSLKRTEWTLKTTVGPKVSALIQSEKAAEINPPTDVVNRKSRAKQQFIPAGNV